ncbi:MAG: hypothetical protein E7603_07445 [Ruminococcaceae bacterium]|nr:hypothetical protein [Oscillospiraceae bacterium]
MKKSQKSSKKRRKLSQREKAEQNKKLIRQLKTENRRLRKEMEYLQHICEQYEPPEEEYISEEQKVLMESAQNADVLHAKSYFAYLFARLRRSRLFRLFDKTRFAMKKFKFAKKLWFFMVSFVTVLGVSAQVLVIIGALAVFLPAGIVLATVFGLYTYFTHRKRKKLFTSLIEQTTEKEKFYLICTPKNGTMAYFAQTLPAFAEKGQVFIICRSFKECGSAGVIKTEDNIYKIHISHYFSFVRRLPPERVVKVYL